MMIEIEISRTLAIILAVVFVTFVLAVILCGYAFVRRD